MTAQELAEEMHKFGLITHNRWAIDGAAMLRQQAGQIESLKADAGMTTLKYWSSKPRIPQP